MIDPSTLAVTGADGFLGWHVRCRLHPGQPRLVLPEHFESVDALARALDGATTVLHLAGMNRGPDSEVFETNLRLATRLTEALDLSGSVPTLLFANSTHSLGDTPFGRSKREAARILSQWARDRGARFVDVILPHLFGEGGRPFYNSGFATFCHQLATGGEPRILVDGEVELLHAQRAVERFLDLASGEGSSQERLAGAPMRISEALARLRALDATYREGVFPDLRDPLDLEFFNTFRSYLYPARYPVPLQLRTDPRGCLFEAVKGHQGGQTFISTTHPGITRGRHYHRHKVERFLVIEGRGEIRIRRLFDTDVKVFPVSGEAPAYLDIPTFHAHEITNVGEGGMTTLFWSHEIFDPARPDTYSEPVILEP